jgi:N-acetylmuramoyl-L-alanine amidase
MLGLKIGRIVLDPGHGGQDLGTIGPNGLREKDLTLAIARELKAMLEDELGAHVFLTRDTDVYVSLEERTALANHYRADLFLSIHANSSRHRSTSGVETYYLDFAKSDAEREIAARENASGMLAVSELEDLVKQIAQAEKSAESRELASIMQKRLYTGARRLLPSTKDRGVRRAPFIVLIGARMPSILAEVAFISNPRDEGVLGAADGRKAMARALYEGIVGYVQTLGGDLVQNLKDGE